MKSTKIRKVSDELKNCFDYKTKNHPALIAAEKVDDESILQITAEAVVAIKSIIKDTINKLNSLADVHASDLDEEDIDELAAVASEFDKSGDDLLKKQADVLDQVIINFGQISGTKAKEAQEKEIEKIRAKYREQESEDKYNRKDRIID
jgi:hypothetical protein